MDEVFKDIAGFPGYKVSDLGRVMSPNTILRPNVNKNGYHYISLRKGGKCVKARLHRLVATAFIPNPEAMLGTTDLSTLTA